jgi:PTS system nitrogen regulatory IIA component
VPGLGRIIAALAVAPAGVEFEAIDHRPVKIFVAILAPDRAPGDQLRALARVSKLLRDRRVREQLVASASPADLLRFVADEEVSQP